MRAYVRVRPREGSPHVDPPERFLHMRSPETEPERSEGGVGGDRMLVDVGAGIGGGVEVISGLVENIRRS